MEDASTLLQRFAMIWPHMASRCLLSLIARAVEAGAAGILSKTAHLDEVVEAVRRLRAGETIMPLGEVVELLRFGGEREGSRSTKHARL